MKYPPIVCIGASAGGLKELEVFFKSMPDNKKAAFVIIQHLAPDHESIMADIVNRYTQMEASQIQDDTEVTTGKVYVIPPNKELTYKEGRLLLRKMNRDSNRQLPIDIFLRSLEALGDKAISVILSGSGYDGSLGIKSLKEAGGLIIVQDPHTAEYDGMPRSALDTGLVDFCIDVKEMPEVILKYIGNGFEEKKDKKSDEKDDKAFKEIFGLIKSNVSHDFTHYKKNTIKRRIDRRMTVNRAKNLKEYIEVLKKDSQEIVKLYKELLISVTSFFRDKDTFEYIKETVVPRVVENAQEKEIRLWIPACATGEEAYTLCMLFKDHIRKNNLNNTVKIFASDIDPDAIAKAREGYYGKNIVVDIPQEFLDAYFVEEENGFRIKQPLREQVVFAEQNLLSDPPYSKLDLISCRNLLIYLDNEAQQMTTLIFHYALKDDGILLLGNSETLGQNSKFYSPLARKHKIYTKLKNPNLPRRIWSIMGEKHKDKEEALEKQQQVGRRPLKELVNEHLLERFVPSSVIVNDEKEILYIQGKMGQFLEMSTGAMSNNLIKVAKDGLKTALANGIRKAMGSNKEVRALGLKIRKDKGGKDLVDIYISPLKNMSGLLSVTFYSSEQHSNKKKSSDEDLQQQEGIVEELEQELAEKERYLQSIIEELETTNEELKSSNEEAQSTNEELQSTNEELETSKEELQSVNEELSTTNSELNNKVEELTNVSNTLNNLLSSTEIATVFLDRNFCIFKFTPSIASIVNLLRSDIGRPFAQFTHNLEYDNIVADAKEVLQKLIPKNREVRAKDGNYFWMQINPFRTMEDRIEGVVITFTDISDKKEKEEELRKYQNRLEEMVEEKTAEVKSGQKRFEEISYISNDIAFSYKIAGDKKLKWEWAIGHMEEVAYQDSLKSIDIDKLPDIVAPNNKEAIKAAIKKLTKGENIETELRIFTEQKKEKWIRLRANPIRENAKITRVIGTINDITNKKKSELKLAKNETLLKQTERVAGIGSWDWEIEGDKVIWSENMYKMFGMDPKEEAPSLGKQTDVNFGMYTKESILKAKSELENAMKVGSDYEVELDGIRRNGEIFHCIARGKMVQDENGKVIRAYGSLQDVTERKRIENALRISDRKFRNIAENVPGLVLKYALHADGADELLYISKGVEDVYEIPQETASKNVDALWAMIHEDDIEDYRASVMHSAKYLNLWKKEFRIKMPDGRVKWLRGRGVPNKDENGVTIWDSLVIDITEKIESEKSLRESEETFKAIFENGITANVIADDNGNYKMANGAAFKLFGYSKKEILKMNVADILADAPKQTSEQYAQFIEQGIETGEIALKTKDGKIKPAMFHAIRIKKDFNLSVLIDITDFKNAMQNLEENKATLEKLNNSKDKILAIIGHDIKSPVSQITLLSQMAQDGGYLESEAEKDDFINKMHVLSRNLSSLVDNLLNWAVSQMGRIEFKPNAFDIGQLCLEIMNFEKVLADKKSVALICEIEEGIEVYADKELIRIVIRNLLVNALKFSKNKEIIEIDAKRDKDKVVVSIRDEGIGMPKEKLNSLFKEDTVKSSRGTAGEKGTGLGLSLSRDFVKLNGGEIWAESTEKKGSTFFFSLPVGPVK